MRSKDKNEPLKQPMANKKGANIPLASDDADNLINVLSKIPDPRHARGIRYRFSDLLLMCIYSVLADYSKPVEVQMYVSLNFDYFHTKIGLKNVPSHDTFDRILRLTDFTALSICLDEWLRINYPQIYALYADKKVLHMDGKTITSAYEKSEGKKPAYYMNAMYEGGSVGLQIMPVNEKENEITCLPEYMDIFKLDNTIVTVDGIGCNPRVIGAINTRGGNYLVPLKNNQPKLRECALNRINELEQNGEWKKLPSTSISEKNHGRIESTTFTMIEDMAFIKERLGLTSFYGTIGKIGVMDKKVITKKNGKDVETNARSLFITDLEKVSVSDLLKIRRSHWHIEAQHWILDVELREDDCVARRDNARPNGAILRRFCMAVKTLAGIKNSYDLFIMATRNSIYYIEDLLFNKIQSQKATK